MQELRSLSDRNAIALEWDIVNKDEIAGYYIQRSENGKNFKTIAKIKNKYVSHYIDTDLKPNKIYFYKISTFTKKGIPSYAIMKKVKTLPTLNPIAFVANGELKVKGVIKIIFRPHANERVKGYYIQRFNDKNGKWNTIANLKQRLSAEYIDNGLVDGKIYRYRIIAYTFDGLESIPSKSLIIQTLQKPKMITNLTATTNLANKIEISWQKVKDAVEYNIYSSENGKSYNLIATTTNNHYIDSIMKSGFSKYYKVSSVDKYGIESLKSQMIMGTTLPLPAMPIVSLERGEKSVKFILSSPDKRAVKFMIKKINNGKSKMIDNIKSIYIDNDIQDKNTYFYEIYSVDENGLVSKPTKVEEIF